MTDRMPGPTSHTYFSQRLRLHYVDWGNPGKPPLLLVHGGRDHCRNWDWVAEALRDEWHIIAPDLRGHGDSQWSTDGSYTMAGSRYNQSQFSLDGTSMSDGVGETPPQPRVGGSDGEVEGKHDGDRERGHRHRRCTPFRLGGALIVRAMLARAAGRSPSRYPTVRSILLLSAR